ncbi:MAG TPA: peptidylprolyl isomerase [Terriglobales bacterium]|nr:peptidylprolyl isomerase [Terriglobales bacterium]
MRKLVSSLALIVCLTVITSAQTTPAKSPAKKPATSAAKTASKTPAKAAPAAPKDPVAIFNTTVGKLTCTLFPKQAPKTVENFIGLATGTKDWTDSAKGQVVKGRPLYSGTIFHRVIPNFMIQGGDPLGNGTGGPGYRFENENVPELLFDRPGRLAMANAGRDTNGSQFFITEVPYPSLDGGYTIFGQCDDASVEIVKQISRAPRDPRNDRPDQEVRIESITIVGAGKSVTPAKPAVKKPTTAPKSAPKSAPKTAPKSPAKTTTPTTTKK